MVAKDISLLPRLFGSQFQLRALERKLLDRRFQALEGFISPWLIFQTAMHSVIAWEDGSLNDRCNYPELGYWVFDHTLSDDQIVNLAPEEALLCAWDTTRRLVEQPG
jgi:hypothetical protein